jgi:type II secretory pathway pseudopilin PulG
MPASESPRAAFTLVELLALLFMLTIIVTITALVLRETRRGAARSVETEAASYTAVNALDNLRRDLARAVGGGTFTFLAAQDRILTNQNCHELCFVALTESVTSPERATSCFYYWIETSGDHDCGYAFASNGTSLCGDLVRAEVPIPAHDDPLSPYRTEFWCLTNRPPPEAAEIVARHVTGFTVLSTADDGTVLDDWLSTNLPLCVDVYLEVLPVPAARRIEARRPHMADVHTETVAALEDAVVRRAFRAFLSNRRGYHAR